MTTYSYSVGDPDPTRPLPHAEDYCQAWTPADIGLPGYWCTLPVHHGGDHVAGDLERVLWVWPQITMEQILR